jgi:hypothetical protein
VGEPSQKKAGGVAQGVGPEFKLQYYKKTKNPHQVKTSIELCLRTGKVGRGKVSFRAPKNRI